MIVRKDLETERQLKAAGKLTSWKEIAAHFGVTVRTAQKWEAERGLPVERRPGPRGRVYADPAALDAWLKLHEGARLEQAAGPPPYRYWLWLVAVLTVVALAAAAWVFSRPGSPAAWRVEGQTLVVTDARGRAVWRYDIDHGWKIFDNRDRMAGSGFGPLFADLDGDGGWEFLIPLANAHSQPFRLLCFSQRGELRWLHAPKAVARVAGQDYVGPWLLRAVVPVPRRDSPGHHLFTAWSHSSHYPAVARMLDVQGNVVREYWHSGHIANAIALDMGDGRGTLVYAAGIANGYRQATLLVLHPERFAGSSREENPAYQILDQPAPVEEARILFPRSWLNRRARQYNVAEAMTASDGGLMIEVRELYGGPAAGLASSIFYRLGPGLRLESVDLNDGMHYNYSRLSKEPGFPQGGLEAEKLLFRNLRFLTPQNP